MTRSGSHPTWPSQGPATARVIDPTQVFPGPGSEFDTDAGSHDPTPSGGRVVVGEVLRRRHRAPRPHRRGPGVVGAAVLSATGVVAGFSLLLHHQSSNAGSGSGRQSAVSAEGRPPGTAQRSLPGAPTGQPGGNAASWTPGATHSTPARPPVAAMPTVRAGSPADAGQQATDTLPGPATGGTGVAGSAPTSATVAAHTGPAAHGRGLHLGSGGPLRPLPPGLARG